MIDNPKVLDRQRLLIELFLASSMADGLSSLFLAWSSLIGLDLRFENHNFQHFPPEPDSLAMAAIASSITGGGPTIEQTAPAGQ